MKDHLFQRGPVFIIICLLFFCSQLSFSQSNIVSNPSFEDTIACPNSLTQISYATNWFSPTLGTPDYFNSCSTPGSSGVPDNNFGYQNPRTGNAYSGFVSMEISSSYREYMTVKLLQPMKAGKKYCVSFYVSLSNISSIASDGIGLYLSNDTAFVGTIGTLPYIPQMENGSGNIISDTLNWILLTWQYTSVGDEQYVTIGNFKSNLATQYDTVLSNQSDYAYYYVDDVSVICCESDGCLDPHFFVPTAFSPNGDNNNDLLHVIGAGIKEFDLSVYDRWGELVFRTTEKNEGWDGTFKGSPLDAAVFVYYFSATMDDGSKITEKGNITLVR